MKNTLAAALLAVSVWGCAPGDAEARHGDGEQMEMAVAGPTEWSSTAPGGTEVTLRPDSYPVEVGSTQFHITLDRAVPDGTPVSIDVLSLDMPAMGILRYPAEVVGPKDYMARAEISMTGAWAVYVNLGDGTDAASFEFDVEPGLMGSHDHGGTTSGEMEDPEPAIHAGHEGH
jgi:hypothetical protein